MKKKIITGALLGVAIFVTLLKTVENPWISPQTEIVKVEVKSGIYDVRPNKQSELMARLEESGLSTNQDDWSKIKTEK